MLLRVHRKEVSCSFDLSSGKLMDKASQGTVMPVEIFAEPQWQDILQILRKCRNCFRHWSDSFDFSSSPATSVVFNDLKMLKSMTWSSMLIYINGLNYQGRQVKQTPSMVQELYYFIYFVGSSRALTALDLVCEKEEIGTTIKQKDNFIFRYWMANLLGWIGFYSFVRLWFLS